MTGINECSMEPLFSSSRTIAVVGLSNDETRPSYGVAGLGRSFK